MASSWLPCWLRTPTWAGGSWPSAFLGTFEVLRSVFNKEITVGGALLAGMGVSAVSIVLSDIYRNYWSLPVHLRGTASTSPTLYLFSACLRLFRYIRGLDGTSTQGIYAFLRGSPTEEIYRRTFLKQEDVPVRRAPRPTLVHQGIPHRQVPQVIDPQLEEKVANSLRAQADEHRELCAGPSRVEPDSLALFLPRPAPGGVEHHPDLAHPSRFSSPYEFVHVHFGEGSLHLILSPLDAALAIERGWAVRFPLAGAKGRFWNPEGRLLIYAPRDEQEVEVVEKLVRAGYNYFAAGMKG